MMFRHWRGAVSVAALGGRTLSSLPVHPVRGLQNMRLSSLPNKTFVNYGKTNCKLPSIANTRAWLATSRTMQKTGFTSLEEEYRHLRPIGYWLLGSCGMVYSMVVLGGLTRLTRSGLSMVEWSPTGSLPPLTQEEWEVEFEKYKQYPEYKKLNVGMTLDEFKSIFWYEYGHRMLGRLTGLVYIVPAAFFLWRGQISTTLKRRLILTAGLFGTQGLIGWFMVKSGLEDDHITDEPRVSPYRLALHLGSAFTIYSYMLWTALDILRLGATPEGSVLRSRIGQSLRRFAVSATGAAAVTVVSGAFVAGLGAGFIYNEFPLMGGRWIPEEIFDKEPILRNFTENMATVQFDHRVLATLTTAKVLFLYLKARRAPLPPVAARAANVVMGLVVLQYGLGVTTLLTCVPVSLGTLHQAGALALTTGLLWFTHTLRVNPGEALSVVRRMIRK